MNGEQRPPEKPRGGSSIPNLNVIKGLLAIIFGLAFMVWSYKIIFNMALFIVGGMLIYYGLVILKIKQVTDLIDQIIAKVKRFF